MSHSRQNSATRAARLEACTESIANDSANAHAIHVEVLRAHVADAVRLPGTDHIDPQAWDPLIMKFCDFFGDGRPLIPSRLAAGWRMPGRLEAAS